MAKRGKGSTGGNLEPLPFVRKFGPDADDADTPAPPTFNDVAPKSEPVEFTAAPPPGLVDSDRGDERRRSRSRSRERKKRHRRSRSGSRHKSGRRSSRSRSRERERDRKRSRRTSSHHVSARYPNSGSRSRDYERRDRDSDRDRFRRESSQPSAPPPPPPPTSQFDTSLAQVTNVLPPRVRSTVVAQSILAKPEALSTVINEAVGEAKETGVDLTVALPADLARQQERERRRKSRWSSTKSFVPGMPTILPSGLDENAQKCYLLKLEIEESTRKIRLGDFMGPENDRSPSPEPVYDSNGKRLNTRDVRKRQELEAHRHEKIQILLRMDPLYKPPADYRAPNIRLHDKVYIPQENHPEINFVGLLIGPRGNTLKALEQETEAKIIIRGKGSVKEGKLGRREGPLPGENEPLHAYVTGPSHEIIKRAVDKINEIINAALMIPDGQNELRKLQLRELAVLNGTLRPEDILGLTRCSNCGSDQHKTWECMDAPNVTAAIICPACGGAGHIARDCKNPRPGYQYGEIAGMDEEYSALMAELGEGTPNAARNLQAQFGGQQQKERVYTLPSGAPIQRFKKPADSGSLPPPPAFLNPSGFSGTSDQSYYNNTYDQSAGWVPPPPAPPGMAAWGAYPMPVPPPPSSSQDSNPYDFLAPPPPPPPPPAEDYNNFYASAAAPPPPPPPPPS